MSVQSLDNEQRIFFLMEFVETLILNSAQDQIIREKIEAEKIKRKFLDKTEPYEEFGKSVIFKEDYDKSIFTFAEPKIKETIQKPRLIFTTHQFTPRQKSVKTEISPVIGAKKISIQSSPQINQKISSPQTNLESNSDFKDPLGKIETLIKDVGIQLIECPGPGKNILVKVRNKINITKIVLTIQEIEKIIEYFSQEAKIPVMNGILKAAVGDMIISAVLSQYVGSRFIITKKSPYSLIS